MAHTRARGRYGPGVPKDWSEWWWSVALDGIVGGILTGAIAGWAVWATLRHERKMSAESELRNAVMGLRTSALRAAMETPHRDATPDSVAQWAVTLYNPLDEVRALSILRAKGLFEDLSQVETRLASLFVPYAEQLRDGLVAFDAPGAQQLARDVSDSASHWLAKPKAYRRRLADAAAAPLLTPPPD